MKSPKKLSSEDLQHPKGQQKGWNGDTRKPRTSRWNGAPDMDDTGFMSRGVHSVTPPIPTAPETTPGTIQSPPTSVAYGKPYDLLDDRQKALHNRSLRDNKPEVISLTNRQKKLTFGRGK